MANNVNQRFKFFNYCKRYGKQELQQFLKFEESTFISAFHEQISANDKRLEISHNVYT